MKLLRPDDVLDDGTSLVFRYSRRGAVAGVCIAVAAVLALGIVGLRQHAPIAGYLAAVIAIALLLSRRAILARFRTSNWLVVVNGRGLLVQLRSYLNHHFPASDRTVAFISYSEIRAAWSVREETEIPDVESRNSRNTTTQRRRLVALELSADTTAIADALREEQSRPTPREKTWYGSSGIKYQHYPVTLPSPTRLEVEWRVTPPAEILLEALQAAHVVVREQEHRTTDSARLDQLSRDELEQELLTLAMNGQTMAAVKIARRLYGFDLTEAKQFIDGLRGNGGATRKRAG